MKHLEVYITCMQEMLAVIITVSPKIAFKPSHASSIILCLLVSSTFNLLFYIRLYF